MNSPGYEPVTSWKFPTGGVEREHRREERPAPAGLVDQKASWGRANLAGAHARLGTRPAQGGARVPSLAPPYAPRQPTETPLYRVVRASLETFLQWARETYSKPVPRYVEQDLRGYLRCGVFAHGFVRARCDACGHDLLVAFSCKGRGICQSCAGRRMANTAAHMNCRGRCRKRP